MDAPSVNIKEGDGYVHRSALISVLVVGWACVP